VLFRCTCQAWKLTIPFLDVSLYLGTHSVEREAALNPHDLNWEIPVTFLDIHTLTPVVRLPGCHELGFV